MEMVLKSTWRHNDCLFAVTQLSLFNEWDDDMKLADMKLIDKLDKVSCIENG